jgi:hypothetical protein
MAMGRNTYSVGDTVVLRADRMRPAEAGRTCRIVAILPAAEHGEAQYRVRFGTENFERRIVEHDIDPSETALPARERSSASAVDGKPWLKPLSIRTNK